MVLFGTFSSKAKVFFNVTFYHDIASMSYLVCGYRLLTNLSIEDKKQNG